MLKEDEAHPSSPGMGAMAAFAQASHRFTSFASAKEAVNAVMHFDGEPQPDVYRLGFSLYVDRRRA